MILRSDGSDGRAADNSELSHVVFQKQQLQGLKGKLRDFSTGILFLDLFFFGPNFDLGQKQSKSVQYGVRTPIPATAKLQYNEILGSKHVPRSKPLVFATDRPVNVIIRVRQHGKDPYRDTPTSVYLNN